MIASKPIRILHIVGGMTRGGIETWLMHVLRHLDPQQFRLDFLVHTDQPCAYDEELQRFGCQLHRCPHPDRPWQYARQFREILRRQGPYQIVHSHVHHFSGLPLRIAAQQGVPVRIAHSHNDTREIDSRAGWKRRLYLGLMNRWIRRYATQRLACSREAGLSLFGSQSPENPWRIQYIGIDLDPFRHPVDRALVRAELGLPTDSLVVGHVGRFMEQKNHAFLIQIFNEVLRQEPRAHLLLVGEGPLKPAVENQVGELGLSHRVHFLGSRPDVPRLMRIMDVFVLPSLHEGLPLVGMEVQAADLPLVMTETVSPEMDVVPDLVRRLSLHQPASVWAEAVLTWAKTGSPLENREALSRVERCPFNIEQGIRDLQHLYGEALSHA